MKQVVALTIVHGSIQRGESEAQGHRALRRIFKDGHKLLITLFVFPPLESGLALGLLNW